MRLGISVLVFSLVGCASGPSISCTNEDEYMGCKNPPERITQNWVVGSGSVQPKATFFNRTGARMIALGSADTVGAVVVTPQQANGTANSPILVTAGSPYVGFLQGPLNITAVNGYESLSAGSAPGYNPILDILLYEEEPVVKPERGAFFAEVIGSVPTAITFPVRGRKRISVLAQCAGITSIFANRTLNNSIVTVDSIAGGAGVITHAEWNGSSQYTATAKVPGFGTYDTITVLFASSPGNVNIEAWDF